MDYHSRVPSCSGGLVARAKRTDRAEARRRYRAQLAAEGGTDADQLDDEETVAPDEAAQPSRSLAFRRGPTRSSGPDTVSPAPAGGIRGAFREAFRPLNLREDLRLLPRLLLHRSFWLPSLLAAVTAGAVIAFQGRELISQFALTYFIYPPPIGAIFLAGFMAPRASYLIGALVGVVSSVLLAITVASVPSLFPGATVYDGLLSGLSLSPLSGIFFGSAAAWYRRFLFLASPARQMNRRRPPARGTPVRGR
jgi:hypothetical protein